jgi:hypothetical protein
VNEVTVKIIYILVGTIFAAGVAFGTFKRVRKDVNGIGKRQRAFEHNAKLAIMAACPPAERAAIAELLKDS